MQRTLYSPSTIRTYKWTYVAKDQQISSLPFDKKNEQNKTHYLLKICRQMASRFSLIMLTLLLLLPWITIAWINARKDWLLASRSISLCSSVRYCFVICNISLIVWISTDTSETFSAIIQWRYDFPLLSSSERIMLSQNGAELED